LILSEVPAVAGVASKRIKMRIMGRICVSIVLSAAGFVYRYDTLKSL
jgi:hypothetical protein